MAALFDGFSEPTPVYHQKPTTESDIYYVGFQKYKNIIPA
jgi:hypothetical protein